MPGCRKLDAPSTTPRPGVQIDLSRYVRLRARPPRPANDNRRSAPPRVWHWALLAGMGPAVGLVAALSILL